MAVTITQTPGAPYTWATSSWSWDSDIAGKSWDGAYPIAFGCVEQDSAPSLSAVRPKAVGVNDFSAWATAEAYADIAAFVRNASSAFATSELYADLAGWLNDIAESFGVSSVDVSGFTKVARETLASAEASPAGIAKAISEAFAATSAQTDVVSYVRANASAFALAEAITSARTFFRAAAEALGIAEASPSDIVKAVASAWATAEARSDIIAFIRNNPEALGVAAAEPTSITKAAASAWATAEARTDIADFVRNAASSISWSETYFDNIAWINAIAEALDFADAAPAAVTNVEGETAAFAEAFPAAITSVKARALAFAETLGTLLTAVKTNNEAFSISSAAPTGITKAILRSMLMRSSMLRNVAGVFGDLSIRNAPMTLEQFAAILEVRAPVGHTDWKPYLPGDYQFQDAIVHALLEPFDAANETLSVQSLKTTVDVQDLSDRGSVSLSSSGATVTFSRTFTVAPQVVAQQTGGAVTAIPVVSSITTTSFFVRLFDAANPSSGVAGNVAWSAIGY